jgi:hypothetical protein
MPGILLRGCLNGGINTVEQGDEKLLLSGIIVDLGVSNYVNEP